MAHLKKGNRQKGMGDLKRGEIRLPVLYYIKVFFTVFPWNCIII